MSRKHTLSAVVFCLFVSLSSPFLFGQATGSFSGTVTDNAGALVTAAGMRVLARDEPRAFEPQSLTPEIARSEGWTFGVL